jgi:twitching motility protein PilU
MVAEGASDLHLSAGHKPRWRINGDMNEVADAPVLGPSQVFELLKPVMAERHRAEFTEDSDSDFAYAVHGLARFRVNLFRDHHGTGAVFRQIPSAILSLDQLGFPPVLKELCEIPKGLVLVTGPTGCGKSTTLAAMVDHINKTRKLHIVTLEDPIEFVHPHRGCVVTQREVGVDTATFASGLKSALRQAPDVILIGEMRDLETVEAALHFSETGHLVLGTLHANNANQAVERVMNFFEANLHAQIYQQLALNLRGVVSQRLVPRADGGGRVAAIEVMLNSPRVADLVARGEIAELKTAIENNAQDGSQTFDQALYALYRRGDITLDEALRQADSANNLRVKVRVEGSGAAERPGFKLQGDEEGA